MVEFWFVNNGKSLVSDWPSHINNYKLLGRKLQGKIFVWDFRVLAKAGRKWRESNLVIKHHTGQDSCHISFSPESTLPIAQGRVAKIQTKSQYVNIQKVRRDITTCATDIRRIMKEYYEQIYTSKFYNSWTNSLKDTN